MYNYIGTIRKSTAITHCISCNFFDEEKLNLVLSKIDRIEFYDLVKDGLVQNRFIDIYGKINLILSIPSKDKRYKLKDNIFVLSDDLDFSLFSYNKTTNNIDSIITGSIREEIGRKQDNILYSLDNLKNFLLISAFKNIFKLVCVNNEMRIMEKYKDFTIKYYYEDILFMNPFSLNYYLNEQNKKDYEYHFKNLLIFAVIKTDIIDGRKNNNRTEINNNDLQQEVSFETFQIKIELNNYIYYPYNLKNELIYQNKNLQLNNKKKEKEKENNKNDDSYIIEDINLFQKIDISDNPTVSLMIINPDGLIIIFFSNYVIYYKYEPKKKKLITKEYRKIKYTDRKYINYTIIDEQKYKYFVIDEYGNLFLLAFINPFIDEKCQFIFQFLGEINYSTCLTYLDNNYLFVGSYKSNSQLIKLETKNNSFIKFVENYESLAPISNLTLINNNVEDENNIELLTISGIEKNCCIKTIKKGTPAIFQDEIEIKNIKNVFKISLDENKKIYTFVIVTTNKSFIIDYHSISNKINLNTRIKFNTINNNINEKNENEIVLFAKNIFESIISMVTNSAILIYKINEKEIKLETRQIFDKNNKIKPLLIKYNERLDSIFIYFNNNKFLCFKIDENGQILFNKELLNNVNMTSFGICKYFIIYSQWDTNNLGIYSINTGKNNFISKLDSSDYIQISSIEIIKIEGIRFVIISLSNGKLVYLKLKEQFRNYNYYEFTENDFIFKRKYNLANESFTVRKIKLKDNNYDKKYLFLDTSTPSFIYFNKETPVILNLNVKHCKNIISLEENKYLFIYNNKIVFGSLSNVQSQNIHSKLYGKQLYNISVISFGNYNLNVYKGEGKQIEEKQKNENIKNKKSNFILAIEEEKLENINKTSLVLSDEHLNEISRYNFINENEICTSFSEIYNSNETENKLIIAGTGISESPNEEPVIGYIYLIKIVSNNNYEMKKLKEIETRGGIYKVRAYKNIIYASIGNIFLIYKLNKNYENNIDAYDIKLIRKCNDFTLINDIYIFDYNKNWNSTYINNKKSKKDEKKNDINKNNKKNYVSDMENEEDEDFDSKINFSYDFEEDEKNEEIKSKTEENIHYLIISDLYRSIVLYSYDVSNDKFNEMCRDYNLTWVYGISQIENNLLYISDIDGNIVTLEKNIHPKSDQERFKFDRKAYFNLGERINSLVMTSIKNRKLYLLSSENNKIDIIKNSDNYEDQNINLDDEVKVTYFGTLEGSLGIIISLNKEIFDFLKALQNLIIKKVHNNGNFNYQKYRSFKDGFNLKISKGFIEGKIIEDFLNFDESYKNNLLNELNYPWNKNFNDVINIIETLAKCH